MARPAAVTTVPLGRNHLLNLGIVGLAGCHSVPVCSICFLFWKNERLEITIAYQERRTVRKIVLLNAVRLLLAFVGNKILTVNGFVILSIRLRG
jgi:hypothetical protein